MNTVLKSILALALITTCNVVGMEYPLDLTDYEVSSDILKDSLLPKK